MTHTIFHLDIDSFFVSAERLQAPSLRGRPVAVGGDGPRGVIASASYEARKFGVRSAMPTARALKACPELILVPPNFSLYSELSRQVFDVVARFTPVFEAASIDEGYLDMTGTSKLWGEPLEAARKLRSAILEATKLTASIGIASNRLVAKIASDYCKPDNIHQVESGQEAAFLEPMPVDRLPGVGPKTRSWLLDREIKIIGQLQRYPIDVLEKRLGKFGRYLFDAAWGNGSTEFHAEAKTRSISRERTFEQDVADDDELKSMLWQMTTELARELRESGDYARGVRIKLRYPPFHTVTRSRVLDRATQTDRELHSAIIRLFDDSWEGAPLRLLGMACVLGSADEQLSLFDNRADNERQDTLDRLRDRIQSRFGKKALKTGRDL